MGIIFVNPKSLLTLTSTYLPFISLYLLCCGAYVVIFSLFFLPNHNMILLFLDHMNVPKGYYISHKYTHTKQYPTTAYITNLLPLSYSLFILYSFLWTTQQSIKKTENIINACKKSSSNILKDIKHYTKHI